MQPSMGVLKILSKFTGEHTCRSVTIEITLRHGCSPVNLLHIFRTPFPKNTAGWLRLSLENKNFSAQKSGFLVSTVIIEPGI